MLGSVSGQGGDTAQCRVLNISDTGLLLVVDDELAAAAELARFLQLETGSEVPKLRLVVGGDWFDCGPARIVRRQRVAGIGNGRPCVQTALSFERNQGELLRSLCGRGVLEAERVLLERRGQVDWVNKCHVGQQESRPLIGLPRLGRWAVGAESSERVRGPAERAGDEEGKSVRSQAPLLRFDSSSYLGLHQHPRVRCAMAAAATARGESSDTEQRLLEEALAAFHGRGDALVFGVEDGAIERTLAALVGTGDAVLRERHSRCAALGMPMVRPWDRLYDQRDLTTLEGAFRRALGSGVDGMLVLGHSVHPLDGSVLDLPALLACCEAQGARLMIDDSHGVGVLGPTGRGIEERCGLVGRADVLIGALSNSLGGFGSYVVGSAGVVAYLRDALPERLVSPRLPAPLCAATREALRLVTDEYGLRDQLWRNVDHLVAALQDTGFVVSKGDSPVVTVFVGTVEILREVSRRLSQAGVRCDSVCRRMPLREEHELRLTLTAQHTIEDLSTLTDALIQAYRQLDLLGRTAEDMWEIGQRYCEPQTGVFPLVSRAGELCRKS